MPISEKLTRPSRHDGDPRIIETGPSSLSAADSAAKGLGWFSLALGAAEIFAARRITRTLGVEGHEGLVRAYGAREILAGVTSLSIDKRPGIWSRVAGDALDLGALALALGSSKRKGNVGIALAIVGGVMLIDIVTARALGKRHGRSGTPRDYSDRSGWPKGLEASRGAAGDFATPADMREEPPAAAASRPAGEASCEKRQLATIS